MWVHGFGGRWQDKGLTLPALAVILLGVVSSCGPGTGESGPTCDAIASHLYDICASKPYSERARSDCEVYGMDRATRTCLMNARECSVTSIDQPCGYVQSAVACTGTSECHSPLMCYGGMCAACGADSDCSTGEVCRNSVCFVPEPT
jgi:hypothetical protein